MYIEKHNQKTAEIEKSRKIEELFLQEGAEERMIEAPREPLISEHSEDVLAHWRAPEFEVFERDQKWYLYIGLILLAIVGWAVYTNSPIMAITFILIGAVGYMYINKNPRDLDFMITSEGVLAGREIYEFKNLKAFWIFYEPDGFRVISLHTRSHLVPYVHIPLHDQDPVMIREILLEYIPEEKQEPGLLETVERLLKI